MEIHIFELEHFRVLHPKIENIFSCSPNLKIDFHQQKKRKQIVKQQGKIISLDAIFHMRVSQRLTFGGHISKSNYNFTRARLLTCYRVNPFVWSELD